MLQMRGDERVLPLDVDDAAEQNDGTDEDGDDDDNCDARHRWNRLEITHSVANHEPDSFNNDIYTVSQKNKTPNSWP